MIISLEDPKRSTQACLPLLSLGFRPFFLCAGISAVVLLISWGWFYAHGITVSVVSPVYWHGHEMIFGYAVAVIAGFLLTAVKNWTGLQTPQAGRLLGLLLVWLSARVLMPFAAAIPYWLIAVIDLLFLPVLALVLVPLLIRSKNYRNLIFTFILLLLFACNVIFHLGVMGLIATGERFALYAGIYIVLLLISIMGGRVIPFFIERGLDGDIKCYRNTLLDFSASASLAVIGILHALNLSGRFAAIVVVTGALLHLWRLAGWYKGGVWKVPLLWVLVSAYAWIVTGLFLMAAAMLDVYPAILALHALTIGGIGIITVGMMVRVSMGHSGRPLVAPRYLPAAFLLLNFAVFARVFLPVILPAGMYAGTVTVAILFWVVAFSIFIYRLIPVFLTPRVERRPGL